MLIAAGFSFLYFLRIQELANELKIGEYNLATVPFGLFVSSFLALSFAVVALLRMGDSRSYDRYLRVSCEKRYESDCELRYLAFPNEHAWGEPFSQLVHLTKPGVIVLVVREIGLLLINLVLTALVLAPLMVGVDFLVGGRSNLESQLNSLQDVLIGLLTITNFLTFALFSWARFADRD